MLTKFKTLHTKCFSFSPYWIIRNSILCVKIYELHTRIKKLSFDQKNNEKCKMKFVPLNSEWRKSNFNKDEPRIWTLEKKDASSGLYWLLIIFQCALVKNSIIHIKLSVKHDITPSRVIHTTGETPYFYTSTTRVYIVSHRSL